MGVLHRVWCHIVYHCDGMMAGPPLLSRAAVITSSEAGNVLGFSMVLNYVLCAMPLTGLVCGLRTLPELCASCSAVLPSHGQL